MSSLHASGVRYSPSLAYIYYGMVDKPDGQHQDDICTAKDEDEARQTQTSCSQVVHPHVDILFIVDKPQQAWCIL